MRRQDTGWEKTSAKDVSDKRLHSKVHKVLLKLDNRKQLTQF